MTPATFSPTSPSLLTATPTTAIDTLSLHAALPISAARQREVLDSERHRIARELHDSVTQYALSAGMQRSEEHTSELQSRQYLVCRLLLEKKNRPPPAYKPPPAPRMPNTARVRSPGW